MGRRTPERCPWCGAAQLSPELEKYNGDAVYGCGAEMNDGEWLCTCGNEDTPAALAYRTELGWRKRLSQELNIPLPLVPEPAKPGEGIR